MFGILNGPFLGMGDTDAIIIKISNADGATNSFVLKVWACVEYRVQTSSPLYRYAGSSPEHDPVAMDIYRKVAQRIPLAVVCAENAKFWEFVSRVIRNITGALSYVPGPVGMIAQGVGAVTSGIDALML